MSSVFGSQILGRRDNQEDGFRIELQNDADPDSDVLMVLADGMGGHAAGEVASRVALDAFLAHFLADTATPRPLDRLEASLRKANEAIAAQVARAPELAGMGCTLIGCLKRADGLAWVSVGDSLLLRVRGGALERLNADHSVYGELVGLVRQGRLSAEEAERHPQRHALRSAVMGGDMPLVDLGQADFADGDTVLLASDGIETLDGERIARLLEAARDDGAEAICQRLLAAVEGAGRPNQDNTTVIALRSPASARMGRPGAAAAGSGRELLDRMRRLALDRPIVAAAGGVVVLLLLVAVLWPTGEPAATTVRQTVTEQTRPPAPVEVEPVDDRAVAPKPRPDAAADANGGATPDEGERAADAPAPPAPTGAPKPDADAAAPPADAGPPSGGTEGAAGAPAVEPEEAASEPEAGAGAGPAAPKGGAGSDGVPASGPAPER